MTQGNWLEMVWSFLSDLCMESPGGCICRACDFDLIWLSTRYILSLFILYNIIYMIPFSDELLIRRFTSQKCLPFSFLDQFIVWSSVGWWPATGNGRPCFSPEGWARARARGEELWEVRGLSAGRGKSLAEGCEARSWKILEPRKRNWVELFFFIYGVSFEACSGCVMMRWSPVWLICLGIGLN